MRTLSSNWKIFAEDLCHLTCSFLPFVKAGIQMRGTIHYSTVLCLLNTLGPLSVGLLKANSSP